MPRWIKGDFPIQSGVAMTKPKDALIAKAAAAFQQGEFANPTKAARSILADYYGSGVWALTDKQQARKEKYLADRINVFIRRSAERS